MNLSDFTLPEEWRNDFLRTYGPLVLGIDSDGFYKDKIEGISTEEVYKILYFCEASTNLEFKAGLKSFDKNKRDLALRYITCRGRLVPRLAIPTSIKQARIAKQTLKLVYFSLAIFLFSIILSWNIIIQIFLLCITLWFSIGYITAKSKTNNTHN